MSQGNINSRSYIWEIITFKVYYILRMIIGELNYQIDKVWEVFWIGGISNPLTVIGPMTHLLFTSKLNELKPMKMQILKYIN